MKNTDINLTQAAIMNFSNISMYGANVTYQALNFNISPYTRQTGGALVFHYRDEQDGLSFLMGKKWQDKENGKRDDNRLWMIGGYSHFFPGLGGTNYSAWSEKDLATYSEAKDAQQRTLLAYQATLTKQTLLQNKENKDFIKLTETLNRLEQQKQQLDINLAQAYLQGTKQAAGASQDIIKKIQEKIAKTTDKNEITKLEKVISFYQKETYDADSISLLQELADEFYRDYRFQDPTKLAIPTDSIKTFLKDRYEIILHEDINQRTTAVRESKEEIGLEIDESKLKLVTGANNLGERGIGDFRLHTHTQFFAYPLPIALNPILLKASSDIAEIISLKVRYVHHPEDKTSLPYYQEPNGKKYDLPTSWYSALHQFVYQHYNDKITKISQGKFSDSDNVLSWIQKQIKKFTVEQRDLLMKAGITEKELILPSILGPIPNKETPQLKVIEPFLETLVTAAAYAKTVEINKYQTITTKGKGADLLEIMALVNAGSPLLQKLKATQESLKIAI